MNKTKKSLLNVFSIYLKCSIMSLTVLLGYKPNQAIELPLQFTYKDILSVRIWTNTDLYRIYIHTQIYRIYMYHTGIYIYRYINN